MSRRTRLLAVVGLVAFVVVGLWLSRPRAAGQGYLTVAVERGPIQAAVSATGTVNPVKTIEVGTYVSGRIVEIDVDFNSTVRQGQRIAKIDPANYEVAVQKAQANLATARARLRRAEADARLKREQFERKRELLANTVISQDLFDAAESAHAQAGAQVAIERAAVQQAEAGLQDAMVNLQRTDILSPVDGVVLSRDVDVGQTVAATFQTPTLFLIADDLTKMQVNASISESDIGSVREGQRAVFRVDAYPGRVFEGEVRQVRNAPVSIQNVVTYDVIIAVANPDVSLKPGMTATVTLITEQREDVLTVPLRALRFNPPRELAPGADASGEDSALWLLDAGKLRRVGVELGLRNEQSVEIADGPVQEGQEVVVRYRRER